VRHQAASAGTRRPAGAAAPQTLAVCARKHQCPPGRSASASPAALELQGATALAARRLRRSRSGSGAPTMRCMRWPGLSIATSNLLLSGLRAQIPRTRADRPRHVLCPACTARGACSVEVVLRQPNCSLRIPPRKPSVLPVSSASLRQLGPMRSPGPCMPVASQAQRTLQTPTARPLCTCAPLRGIPSTLP